MYSFICSVFNLLRSAISLTTVNFRFFANFLIKLLLVTGLFNSNLSIASEKNINSAVQEKSSEQPAKSDEENENTIVIFGSYTVDSSNNATGLNMSPRETPQSMTVITRQQIDDRALSSVAQVLEQTAGINLNQAETDRVFPTARGFNITNVQLDGALVGGAAASVESDFLGDSFIYERVEIIRGAAGMLVGAGNPSAAINLVRKRPTDDFTASVAVKFGRWDLARTEADVSGALGFDGKLRGRLIGAYQENSSYIDFLEQEKETLYGVLEVDISNSTLLTFGIDYQKNHSDGITYGEPVPMFYSDGERTNLPRSTTTGTDWTYRNRDRSISFATLTHEFENEWVAILSTSFLSGKYDDERVYVKGFIDKVSGEGLTAYPGKSAGDRSQKGMEFQLTGPFDLLGRQHDLVVGWNNSYEKNLRKSWNALSRPETGNFFNWNYPDPDFESTVSRNWGYKTKQSGLYLSSRFNVTDPLKVIVGARNSSWKSESWKNEMMIKDESDSGIITPYLGVIYDINDNFSLYGSYTDIFDLQFARDKNDELLDPVKGTNSEIGVKGEFFNKRLNTSFAVFEVEQVNLAVPDVEIMVDGDLEQRYKAEKGVTTKGYEFEMSGNLFPGLQMYTGYTHRKAKNNEGEEVTRHAPRDTFRLSGAYDMSNQVDGLSVGGGLRWQSKIYPRNNKTVGPDGNPATQDNYWLADFFMRYHVTSQLSATLNIDNLFDETYYSSVGQYVFGYYGQPRNIIVSAKWTF